MNHHTLSGSHSGSRANALLPVALAAFLLLPVAIPSIWAQQDQSITIGTAKTTYGPGDTVDITGTVNGGQPGQLVAIQVKDPKGNLVLIRTVQADQTGRFALTFKVPSTASKGAFDITASSRINGFVVTQSTAIATPVPEFPTSELVLVACVCLFIFMYQILPRSGPNNAGVLGAA